MQVEVQGSAVPGFTLDDCVEIVGDHIERVVRWKGPGDLGALAGQPVRLRFVMCECDLTPLRFRQAVSRGTYQLQLTGNLWMAVSGVRIVLLSRSAVAMRSR